ncbi:transcriptional repressor NF-X1 [Octopus bimaculoides]|uniref:R3H domain-containing protein n=1 Tax=Octopus bimaculoides TaxID=37653 RepID=A0A0L8HF08_OCTBM|nr:transcriptional repressor NF-X1 [Octopus bimaculoides]|eukprot:XP_014772945.1 PREDICTED: transcriptional repressor NF-X1-like [Octopus bimaculoides]
MANSDQFANQRFYPGHISRSPPSVAPAYSNSQLNSAAPVFVPNEHYHTINSNVHPDGYSVQAMGSPAYAHYGQFPGHQQSPREKHNMPRHQRENTEKRTPKFHNPERKRGRSYGQYPQNNVRAPNRGAHSYRMDNRNGKFNENNGAEVVDINRSSWSNQKNYYRGAANPKSKWNEPKHSKDNFQHDGAWSHEYQNKKQHPPLGQRNHNLSFERNAYYYSGEPHNSAALVVSDDRTPHWSHLGEAHNRSATLDETNERMNAMASSTPSNMSLQENFHTTDSSYQSKPRNKHVSNNYSRNGRNWYDKSGDRNPNKERAPSNTKDNFSGNHERMNKLEGLPKNKQSSRYAPRPARHSEEFRQVRSHDRDYQRSSVPWKAKKEYNKERNRRESLGKKEYEDDDDDSANEMDDENQRDLLSQQLRNCKYECMVCCCIVYPDAPIWSCMHCYNVFHMPCIKKWALSPAAAVVTDDNKGWRCPVCQAVSNQIPRQYKCFCGKMVNPQWNHYDTPHCCGEPCRKKRNQFCPHLCTLSCHPGPCPSCHLTVNKKCICGKKSQLMKCGLSNVFQCEEVCGKPFTCAVHSCLKVCHSGDCGDCEVVMKQKCFCKKNERLLECIKNSAEDSTSYSCAELCKKPLDCGNHTCEEICHSDQCLPCPYTPSSVTHCPCGHTPITELSDQPRTSCSDPIPTCDKLCNKPLSCGTDESHHLCPRTCHTGPCGPCDKTMSVQCRCKVQEKDFPCSEALAFNENKPFLCNRKCNKKRRCGKHKCTQQCCVRDMHECERECRQMLSCGLHRCESLCHRGNCAPCLLASFEELTCYCGYEVIHPPVPCGTKPPACSRPCTKTHSCDHPVHHNCNMDDVCPPCTVLTTKMCKGQHEERHNIPCHITDISCGMPCNKVLPCVQHKCKKVCHKDRCQSDAEQCTQPCQKPRAACGHPCNTPCHPDKPCPKVACKQQVAVKCPCGLRSANVQCLLGDENLLTNFAKMTLVDLNNATSGSDVDITKFSRLKSGLRQLECNEECSIRERNRRLALALEIKNPDLSSKLGSPSYSQFLKDFAKHNGPVVVAIEKALTDLVQSTKQMKQNYRNHSFSPMNREHRKVVHEMAEHFGCTTESYDNEPNRNVVAIARKDKCWMPSVTLTALLQKERKVLLPISSYKHEEKDKKSQDSKQGCVVLSKGSYQSVVGNSAKPESKPIIDYFDMET